MINREIKNIQKNVVLTDENNIQIQSAINRAQEKRESIGSRPTMFEGTMATTAVDEDWEVQKFDRLML